VALPVGVEQVDVEQADAVPADVEPAFQVLLFVGWMQFVGCPLTAVGYNL